MGYAIRITSRAVNVVSGADQTQGTIAAEATGVRAGGLRSKFTGSQLHSRKTSAGRVVRQGNGWVVENSGGQAPFGSPASGGFTPPSRPASMYGGSSYSPYPASPNLAPPSINGSASVPSSPALVHPSIGLGINPPPFGPSPSVFPTAATMGSPYAPSSPGSAPPPIPRTPSSGYGHFPPTPNNLAPGNGISFPPPSARDRKISGSGKKDD
jgi:endoplasmic reticulum-Golgi intermediate compartment protein 2